MALTYESLTKKSNDEDFGRGSARDGNVDKNAHFYHVMTHVWGNESVFSAEIAQYRQRLLCRICESMGITILFSVTMPNHTHEVFLADRWDDISEAIRLTNCHVSRRVHKTKKWKSDKRVFERYVLYVPIKDIGTLLYVGKYIYENPKDLDFVPFSCFWQFKNGHLDSGYNLSIYRKLFGMNEIELSEFYEHNTKQQVRSYSDKLAATWSKEDSDAVFLLNY